MLFKDHKHCHEKLSSEHAAHSNHDLLLLRIVLNSKFVQSLILFFTKLNISDSNDKEARDNHCKSHELKECVVSVLYCNGKENDKDHAAHFHYLVGAGRDKRKACKVQERAGAVYKGWYCIHERICLVILIFNLCIKVRPPLHGEDKVHKRFTGEHEQRQHKWMLEVDPTFIWLL